MKFKIQAGAEIDVLTKTELAGELRSWMTEITRGVKFIRRSISGVVDGTGLLNIGAGISGTSEVEQMGPRAGFVWAVSRITITGLTTTQLAAVYVNDVSPTQKVATFGADVAGTQHFGDRDFVLTDGDMIVANGTGLTAGAVITIAAQIVEVPVQLAWQIL